MLVAQILMAQKKIIATALLHIAIVITLTPLRLVIVMTKLSCENNLFESIAKKNDVIHDFLIILLIATLHN